MTRLHNDDGLELVNNGVTISRLICLLISTDLMVCIVPVRGELLWMDGIRVPLRELRAIAGW